MSILCERILWCRFKAFYLNDVAENMVHPGMMKDSFYLWFFHFSSWIICFLPPAKCLQFNKIVFEVHTIYMYKVVNYHWSLTYCVGQECLFVTGVHISYNQKCETFDQLDLSDALLESWDVDIAYDILMEVVKLFPSYRQMLSLLVLWQALLLLLGHGDGRRSLVWRA